MTEDFRSAKRVLIAACGAALIGLLATPASADVRDYVRWNRNGQLDYRLLLRRYMPVSSWPYGPNWYGTPYSVNGGLLNPAWPATPVYYGSPRAVY
jgi:hypothetical protein